MAVKSKEFRFPVAVEWSHDRTVVARVPGKPELEIATPPEFWPDADPAVWSPEDAFASAAASCLAVTILGIAAREELPIRRCVSTRRASRAAGPTAASASSGSSSESRSPSTPPTSSACSRSSSVPKPVASSRCRSTSRSRRPSTSGSPTPR